MDSHSEDIQPGFCGSPPSESRCEQVIAHLGKTTDDFRRLIRKYEAIIEFSGLMVFEYDIHSDVMHIPQAISDLYGLPSVLPGALEQLVNHGAVSQASVGELQRLHASLLSGAERDEGTLLTIDRDGKQHVVQIAVRTICDDDGQACMALGIYRDITEKRLLRQQEQYLKAITETNNVTFIINFDEDLIVRASAADPVVASQLTGSSYKQAAEYVTHHEAHPDDVLAFSQWANHDYFLREFKRGRTRLEIEYRRNMGEGPYQWVHGVMNLVKDDITDHLLGFYQAIDIHERKTRESEALTRQGYFNSLVASAQVVLESNITQDTILHLYRNGVELTPPGDVTYTGYVRGYSLVGQVHSEDISKVIDAFDRRRIINAYEQGNFEYSFEYRRTNVEGVMNWFSTTMHFTRDAATGDIIAFMYSVNIHERKLREQELKFQARRDGLTKVYNKTTTKSVIDEMITSEERLGQQSKHAFILFDIDYFKSVNDMFGHKFGDRVIVDVVERVKSLFRQTDVIGRIGGDEFVVFIKDVPNEEFVTEKVGQIIEAANHIYDVDGGQRAITVSAGVSWYEHDGNDFDSLYETADKALYLAKDKGRNTYEFYSD